MANLNKISVKITDQAFSRFLATSVAIILLYMAGLCSTTYAWFIQSIESTENVISIATASDIVASVTNTESGETIATVKVGDSVKLADMQGEYTVLLSLPKGSSSGYLIVTVGETTYYSDSLKKNDSADQSLSFTLAVNEATDVKFTARWGIYSAEPHIKYGDVFNIG